MSKEELARRLQNLAHGVQEPSLGFFGPTSITWKIVRERAVLLAAGRAALLQLAHPGVAWSIAHHSKVASDPVGRFHRTFSILYDLVLGDVPSALSASRRVHGVHSRIRGSIEEGGGGFPKGTAYDANDPDAQRWVLMTLIHSSVLGYELALGPLSQFEKDRYCKEASITGQLLTIPKGQFPQSWRELEDAFAETLPTLAVSTPGRHIANLLLSPKGLAPGAVFAWYRRLTAALLPEKLREDFGLKGRGRGICLKASSVAWRAGYCHLPSSLRYVPAYHEALTRLGQESRGAALGAKLETFLLKRTFTGRS